MLDFTDNILIFRSFSCVILLFRPLASYTYLKSASVEKAFTVYIILNVVYMSTEMFNDYFVLTGLGYNISLVAKILVSALEPLLT